ncbi:MAG: serine/threonine protein kinase [Archangium sp.]|nr:serine/threonine protein kinase [Archangium sp.]
MPCPDAETLARYAEAALSGAAADAVREHVDGCASCRELMVTLVRSSHPSPGPLADTPWDVPVPGTMLGRYRVTGTRGAGGMGVVLSAYDPQLDRQVAIKLLRPDLDAESPERGKLRLVREAQLMARVRHPNVVTVHDVAVEGARVFIAMELVEGQTLRDWLESSKRSPEEILAAFLSAGRGLAAAHHAGVVHRDFKPENVLLDSRGQVLVSDFGLAWSQTLMQPMDGAAAVVGDGHSKREAPWGATGWGIGTPAYMAPEQLKKEPIDARADQFSFCVALWEALEGERPLDDKGTLRTPKSLSRRLHATLTRGLATQPEQRFADMNALLDALAPPRRSPMVPFLAAIAAVLVLGGVYFARQREVNCAPVRTQLRQAWPLERRDAFLARENTRPLGAEVSSKLDSLRAKLDSSWESACAVETPVRTCLRARVDALDVTARVLAEAQTNARGSAALVARLEGPESCEAGELLTLLPIPSGQEAKVLEARAMALSADARRFSGSLQEAEKLATDSIELAKATTWRPAEAEARLALAQVHRARGKFKEAEAELADALLAAEAGRHFEAIARIAVQHILVVGTQTNRPEEAEPWVKRAEAALEQLPRARLRAEVDVAITMLRVSQGRSTEAMDVSDRALKWMSENDPIGAADVRALRSLNFMQFGQDNRALEEAGKVAEARQRLLGPKHPLSLHARLTLGESQARCGLVRQAVDGLQATLDEVRASKDINPITVASGMNGLALALSLGGQPGEALNATKSADELVRSVVGNKHRYTALSARVLAERYFDTGRDEEAFKAIDEAVSIGSEAMGESHRETVESIARRALMRARRGVPGAEVDAKAVLEAFSQNPAMGESAVVLVRLALAWLPGATAEERALALETARRVRGTYHPDVARALMLQRKAGDPNAEALFTEQMQKLEFVEDAL